VAGGGASFTFPQLITRIREVFSQFPDKRAGANTHYSITDIALSGFAVFFMQSTSFLDFQRRLGKSKAQHNLHSLFGVPQVPSDNHIRSILDEVPSESCSAIFDWVLERLTATGELDRWRTLNNDLLLALDGTQYFSSEKLSCPHCRVSSDGKNGGERYSHALLAPAVVKPGYRKALALEPEFIHKRDGRTKADGEITASKRWLATNAERLSPLGVTIVGDDAYAHEPFLQEVLEAEMNFLCICKAGSHKDLSESIASLRESGDLECCQSEYREKGKKYQAVYEWSEGVELTANKEPLVVSWVGVCITELESGKKVYANEFITNHRVEKDSVEQIVAAGRARWKIENEQINTLKTKGYHLEHNFGHGTHHLSETLATLNTLAFLVHTLLDIYDERYRLLREERGRRDQFFAELGTLTRYWYFEGWEALMVFMITQLELPDPGS